MKTTKTVTTSKGTTISITLERTVVTREVCDGYFTKKEAYENYEAVITKSDGTVFTRSSGKPGVFSFFAKHSRFDGRWPEGAVARVGNNYVGQEIYDLGMKLIAECEIATPKSDEQQEIEQEEAARKVEADMELDSMYERDAEARRNGLCPKCGTYCDGDCIASQK